MAVIQTKLTDSWMNENAIGMDLQKLVRDGLNVESLYTYVYNRIVRYVIESNELFADYNDVEDALTGYLDEDDVKEPKAYIYFNAKYLKNHYVDTSQYTEDEDYTEYRKELFRNAQLKLLMEIVNGRLSKETGLESIDLASKEIDTILFDNLELWYHPNQLRSY